jgi:hypothetical protein
MLFDLDAEFGKRYFTHFTVLLRLPFFAVGISPVALAAWCIVVIWELV